MVSKITRDHDRCTDMWVCPLSVTVVYEDGMFLDLFSNFQDTTSTPTCMLPRSVIDCLVVYMWYMPMPFDD